MVPDLSLHVKQYFGGGDSFVLECLFETDIRLSHLIWLDVLRGALECFDSFVFVGFGLGVKNLIYSLA